MKISILDAHDRNKYLIKEQSVNISQGVEDCLKKNELSLILQHYSPYIYIFAHPRTKEDGRTKVMFYQPRLTKPESQTNSYLFRAESQTDVLEVCWLLPASELWGQHKKGNVTESEIVEWSIAQFKTNKEALESPHPDDLSDDKIKEIYTQIKYDCNNKSMMDRLYN